MDKGYDSQQGWYPLGKGSVGAMDSSPIRFVRGRCG